MMPTVGAQTAAYLEAANAMRPNKADHMTHRCGLQVKKSGTYEMHVYDEPGDFGDFQAALRVYRFKERTSKKPRSEIIDALNS